MTVFGILMAICNSLSIGIYGELEFGFSLLKIALIFMVNIMAIVIVTGGAPQGEAIGFKYWHGMLFISIQPISF
jgi:amino acid transporter